MSRTELVLTAAAAVLVLAAGAYLLFRVLHPRGHALRSGGDPATGPATDPAPARPDDEVEEDEDWADDDHALCLQYLPDRGDALVRYTDAEWTTWVLRLPAADAAAFADLIARRGHAAAIALVKRHGRSDDDDAEPRASRDELLRSLREEPPPRATRARTR